MFEAWCCVMGQRRLQAACLPRTFILSSYKKAKKNVGGALCALMSHLSSLSMGRSVIRAFAAFTLLIRQQQFRSRAHKGSLRSYTFCTPPCPMKSANLAKYTQKLTLPPRPSPCRLASLAFACTAPQYNHKNISPHPSPQHHRRITRREPPPLPSSSRRSRSFVVASSPLPSASPPPSPPRRYRSRRRPPAPPRRRRGTGRGDGASHGGRSSICAHTCVYVRVRRGGKDTSVCVPCVHPAERIGLDGPS